MDTFLHAQSQKTYITQLLHQDRDKRRIDEFASRLEQAVDLLKVESRVLESDLSTALARGRRVQLRDVGQGMKVPLASTHVRLPAKPEPFCGRDDVIEAVVSSVTTLRGHVAVLGGPGIGKTSVAVSVLHTPEVRRRYGERRYFVACDAEGAYTACWDFAAAALGICVREAGEKKRELLRTLSAQPTLIVLDNFESV